MISHAVSFKKKKKKKKRKRIDYFHNQPKKEKKYFPVRRPQGRRGKAEEWPL